MALQNSEERAQIAALKAHQRSIRDHKAAKVRVTEAAENLAIAEDDHRVATQGRAQTKGNLLDVVATL